MRISEIEEGILKRVMRPFRAPQDRKAVWAKRLAAAPATTPTAPAASSTSAPTSASGTFGGSFTQPMQATATAKAAPAAPQAKPRMSVRAATGPAYTKGQTKNVGGVQYQWDGTVWRNPSGQPATPAIANAIDQQSRQTS
jgi:hypothetical protein